MIRKTGTPQSAKRKGKFILEMKRNSGYYLMILPPALVLFAFAYVPLPGLIVAFQDFNVVDVFRSPFVGTRNFDFFFRSGMAWRLTRTTMWFNINYLFWTHLVSIAFAIMLTELRTKFSKRIYQNIMFLPHFFSVIIVAHLVTRVVFVDGMGIVNRVFEFFGGEAVPWSREPAAWPGIIVGTHVWRTVGFQTIIYLASIAGIDDQLYEAAAIDGALRPRQIWHITLPMLVPTVIILTLLSIGNMVRGDFALIYNLTTGINRPQLLRYTDIIDTFVFRAIRETVNFPMAAAVGLYQSVVGFVLVMWSNWLVRRYDKDKALF